MDTHYSPIVLFVYNRPWHTRQTIEALQKNKLADESELIIFSDAPKESSVIPDVEFVRTYLKSIKGFKSVRIVEQEYNFGLAKSIISGVTEVVNEYGRVIVLEDDLVTSPYFLKYMNSALEWYEDDEQVMQISAHMFPVDEDQKVDMFFLPFTTTWGWATWKQSWKYFDEQASAYHVLKKDIFLKKKFNLDGAYQYFSMLERQLKGEIDSWGIRWYLSVFVQRGLVLYPSRTLVANIGMDGTGVHCGKDSFLDGETIVAGFNPAVFPDEVEVNEIAYKNIKSFLLERSGKFGLTSKLKSIFQYLLKFNK